MVWFVEVYSVRLRTVQDGQKQICDWETVNDKIIVLCTD